LRRKGPVRGPFGDGHKHRGLMGAGTGVPASVIVRRAAEAGAAVLRTGAQLLDWCDRCGAHHGRALDVPGQQERGHGSDRGEMTAVLQRNSALPYN
jgi:hypothetical protein